jgi:leucyl aminopeptidase
MPLTRVPGQVLERDECERRGMGAYLGVSQGAVEPPKFIHLTYTPKGAVTKRIAFVGKVRPHLRRRLWLHWSRAPLAAVL